MNFNKKTHLRWIVGSIKNTFVDSLRTAYQLKLEQILRLLKMAHK